MKTRMIEPYNQPEPPNYASWPRWARDMVNLTHHLSYNRGLEDAAKVADAYADGDKTVKASSIARVIRLLRRP